MGISITRRNKCLQDKINVDSIAFRLHVHHEHELCGCIDNGGSSMQNECVEFLSKSVASLVMIF